MDHKKIIWEKSLENPSTPFVCLRLLHRESCRCLLPYDHVIIVYMTMNDASSQRLGVALAVRLSDELHARVNALATAGRRSRSDILRRHLSVRSIRSSGSTGWLQRQQTFGLDAQTRSRWQS
ncbi:ribbon-helix-helix protein, CopG family [Corynebacterium sp. 22KM0430]|uniref:ribbon-helix-helix protein, CopG family n=1 Tax=unclassified Corynebacterium TaxID=2624378 RepID=UPI0039B0A040